SVVGTLALIGFPGFSGFYSKDALIEAVHASTMPWAGYAYWCVLLGVFVTALYSFRLLFLVFHGPERIDAAGRKHLHESPPAAPVSRRSSAAGSRRSRSCSASISRARSSCSSATTCLRKWARNSTVRR